ncbi:hypothetical protein DFJ74DRAFT_711283 [Hyaloraphidium curvatum]|nr:hypothetical protein DFJ74DRAFT_711283 [Hyaloraphidium curvatum]
MFRPLLPLLRPLRAPPAALRAVPFRPLSATARLLARPRGAQLAALRTLDLAADPDTLILALSDAPRDMDRDAFAGFAAAVGVKDAARAAALFQIFDADRSGRVSRAELGAGLSAVMHAGPAERRRAVFRSWDLDGNGKLSLEEFEEALAFLDPDADPAKASQQHGELFASLDTDGDGMVDLAEFERGVAGR